MKLPPDIVALLERRFDSKHREWLASPGEGWPLVVPLGVPSEQDALRQVDAVRAWVDSWRRWPGVDWVTRQWRVLGAQQLPASVSFQDAGEVARCIGQQARWERAAQRFAELTQRWPSLARRMARTFAALADYEDADFRRLTDLLTWLADHPCSRLFPRQVPVEGIDSKWIEGRMAVLAELLWHLRGDESEHTDFYALSGLQRPAALIRMRVLDPALRAQLGGLGDFATPLASLAQLQLAPERVLIVENLQTGLALPDLGGTVAFMGLGFSVDLLGHLAWLAPSCKLYWGDLDTHGFAILQRARASLRDVESLLMDEATLLAFRHLANEEPVQAAAATLPLLTREEAQVYTGLKSQRWGNHVRLEQERIPWPHALSVLSARLQP